MVKGSCETENLKGAQIRVDVVVRRWFVNMVLLKISQHSQENTCARVSSK